jgi:methionyl-tRNA formyltransferase
MPCCEVTGIVTNKEVYTTSYCSEGITNVLYSDLGLLARKNNIPFFIMDDKMTNSRLIESIKGWSPEFMLAVGWYHIIPRQIRKIAPVAGLHASLLPSYSGGAPLVWAIINGEEKTGITFFMFDDNIDSGPIIGQKTENIYRHDTIATLYSRMETKGIELIEEYLPKIAEGRVELKPQDTSKRTIMPQRYPEDGEIDWQWSALRIYNFIRAQTKPYPGAFTYRKGNKIIVWKAKIYDLVRLKSIPGQILKLIDNGKDKGFIVATGTQANSLLITNVGINETSFIEAGDYVKIEDLRSGELLGM